MNVRDDTAAKRTWLLREINKAAKVLWESNDLVFALREQYFTFPTDDSQVTLPWYVGQLRGVRRPHTDGRDPVMVNDMRPRYHYNSWGQGLNTFRVKQVSPIATLITSPTQLVISVDSAESVPVTVTVVGSTDTSAATSSVATLAAGETSVTMSKVFNDIKSIRKDMLTECDVVISDERETVLSVIPNMLYEPRYLLVNVTEAGCFAIVSGDCFTVEILYKPTFVPFFNDYDTFGTPNYDEEIAMLTHAANISGDKRNELLSEVRQRLVNKMDEHSRGLNTPMNMAPDPFVRNYENLFEIGSRYGII